MSRCILLFLFFMSFLHKAADRDVLKARPENSVRDRKNGVISKSTISNYTNASKTASDEGARILIYKDLARQAYTYLNQFRTNPGYYGEKIGLDLQKIRASRALEWDPVLTAEAEKKAADMAGHNYFNHVDLNGHGMNYRVHEAGYLLPDEWVKDPAANFIESIAANSKDPTHFIDQLIIDKGVNGLGHRQHLLATTDFYRKASRIGIAIAYSRNSEYRYYCCILIAPRYEYREDKE